MKADSFEYPRKYEVVSDPVTEWNGSNKLVSSSDILKLGSMSAINLCIGIYFCLLEVPAFIHSSLHFILLNCPNKSSRSSVSLACTTIMCEEVFIQWSTMRVSASSWFAIRSDVSILAEDVSILVLSWFPPATTTILLTGACLTSSSDNNAMRSSLFAEEAKKSDQLYGKGTFCCPPIF